jgi:hypothetical protein
MKSLAYAVMVTGMISTAAYSMPLLNQATSMAHPVLTEKARIICEEGGQCFRLPGRRRVARWIYGDGAFYGHYGGSGYYGAPGRHYRWSFLTWPW